MTELDSFREDLAMIAVILRRMDHDLARIARRCEDLRRENNALHADRARILNGGIAEVCRSVLSTIEVSDHV